LEENKTGLSLNIPPSRKAFPISKIGLIKALIRAYIRAYIRLTQGLI
jgi:hypothetical protein